MKQLFLTLVATILIMGLSAQKLSQTDKADITWGEDLKEKKGTIYSKVLTTTDDAVYLMKVTKKGRLIEMRDNKMIQTKAEYIDFDNDLRSDLSYEGSFKFGKNFIVLASYSDKRSKLNSLYYRVINFKTLKADSKWIKIGEMAFEKKRRDGYFSYDLSPDGEKLLLYYSKPLAEKGSIESYGFQIYDNDMEIMWEKDVELGTSDEYFSVRDFIISDLTDVYIIGRSNGYHVVSYTFDGETKDYELDLDDKIIKDITIGFNANGDLICAGLYGYDSGVKGTFYLSINTLTKKVISKNTKEFDEDFITQDWSEKKVKKAKKKKAKKGREIEAYNYDLRDLVLYEDGSATLIAEQYYMYTTTTTTRNSNGTTTTKTTYHYVYRDILVIKIDAQGEIDWMSKIDKYQHSTNDGGYRSSFALQVKGKKLYLIYNLATKRYYKKEEWKQLPKSQRRNYLTLMSEVDRNGEITDELLLNNSEEEIYMVPKFCEQIDDENMFLYTSRKKKIRLGMLEFEK